MFSNTIANDKPQRPTNGGPGGGWWGRTEGGGMAGFRPDGDTPTTGGPGSGWPGN